MVHEDFMRRVIDLAREGIAGRHGYPFGATVVRDGTIVGEGYNMVVSTSDPTAHAEMVAIRNAARKLNTHDLSGCDIYTNGPPCCMCLGSILWARISRVFYTLSMKDSEDIGLPHEHLFEDFSRPLDARSIPFIAMPEFDAPSRAVYDLWYATSRQDHPQA
ncbi:MAG TPA: nucleoside deaminase [Aestuariivirgaceae bacterium]|nr:nucleoside deaminase [Aestuariivirgaceae bacterium]